MGRTGMNGKTVVVTGASSGIGRATALEFAGRGANVVLAARRRDRLEDARRDVEARGVRALVVECDVTDVAAVKRLGEETRAAFGSVDVLVNNAGLGLYGPLEKISDAQVRRVFDVNVHGLLAVTRVMLPLLREAKGGTIVNVSSVLGHRGLPLLGGYSASKAAVNALTESLRAELAAEKIAVLLVSPGLTTSEFRDQRLNAAGFKQEQIPFKEMSAETVAKALADAVASGRRETVLTLEGKLMVRGNRLFPRLMDRVAGRMVGPPAAES